jgi:hypothetical protein
MTAASIFNPNLSDLPHHRPGLGEWACGCG